MSIAFRHRRYYRVRDSIGNLITFSNVNDALFSFSNNESLADVMLVNINLIILF